MGWTYNDLQRNRMTLAQAKAQHEHEAIQYTRAGIKAELLASEWHTQTWYAIIRLTYPEGDERGVRTFLRTDIIDTSGGQFGYKDMTEEMGPHLYEKPSHRFALQVYKHIPFATGYAKDFRKWAGIKFKDENQLELV